MSENVKYGILKDYDGNKFIPIGHSELIYDEDGKSVEERLNAIESSNVQKVAEGTEDGTIAVTTNGVTENVPVHGLGFQDDGSYHFIDNEDNVIAKVDTGGVHSIDFIIDNKDISLTGVKAQADALRTDLNNLSADAIKEVVAGSGLTGGGSNGSVTLNIGAGSGITVAADTISHADTSNLTGAQSASSGKAITSITVDGFGHVTATGAGNVVTDVTAGNGLSTTAASGAITLSANVNRGLNISDDNIGHSTTGGADVTTTTGKTVSGVTIDDYGHVTATSTSDVVNKIKAGTGISVDKTTGEATITNAGVRSIGEGTKKGTISVNTNGTTADVAVNGLGFEDDGSYHFIDTNNKTIVKIDNNGITTSGDVATAETSLNALKTDFTNFTNNVITGVTAGDGLSGGGSAGDVSLKVNVDKGLTIANDKIGHSNAITAGTAQGSATKTLGYGDTFTIPTVTYDAQGHITGKGTTTMTMPKMPTASDLSLTNAMVFLGTTTTPLIDGISTNPISIGGKNITAVNGNVVLYDGKEYVWSSSLTSWEELGDEGSHALKSITITAGDGLTGGGDLSKNMTISHAKEYGVTDTTAKYTSANTTTSISGSGASGTVKIPQIKVDEFGHVVSAADEDVAITMPTINDKTITITAGNGLTTGGSFTTNASSNKEITLNVGAGAGITVEADKVTNSGVRSVASGTKKGTISVNTNGTAADVAVTGLGFKDDGSYHFVDENSNTVVKIDKSGITTSGDVATSATSLNALKNSFDDFADTAVTEVVNGSGISYTRDSGKVTVSHADTSAAQSVSASNGKAISNITVDGFGHITGMGTKDVVNAVSVTGNGNAITSASVSNGTLTLTKGATYNNYSLPLAANGTKGGIQIGYTENGQNYPVELSSEKAYVNVPWTDTKVTAVGNHYTPTANADSALSADASSTTAATWGSTDLVTGVNLQRDAKGHVTGITVDSIQMPANPNTDTKVTQKAAITTNGNYPIILANSIATTEVTNTVNKASTLTYNPSTQVLTAGNLNLTAADEFKFIDKNNNVGATINKDGIVVGGDVATSSTSLNSLKNDFTTFVSGAITGVTAGTGLSGGGSAGDVTINHSNSVAAGTAQGSATKTLTFGGTFTIPTVTYDSQGHITGKGTTTMTMPANPNTNTTYSLSGKLDGNTYINTLTPSSGNATTATVPALTGATSSAAGKAGLVPAPAAGKQASFLRGDGSWTVPTSVVTGDKNGQIKVTPSGGTAYNVDVKGLGFKDDGSYHFIDEDNNTAVKIDKSGITTSGDVATKTASLNGLKSSFDTFVTGAITGVTAGVGLSGGGSAGDVNIDLDVASSSAIGGIKVSSKNTTAVTVNSESTTSGRYYPVELNSDNKAIVNIPWTDTKVTAVGNHYTPTAKAESALNVDASSTTAAKWDNTSLVTGVNIARDAAGHVTGLTVDSVKMPANPNVDTKVTSEKNNTTKAYITGTVAGGNGTLVYDDKVYLDTTAGQLSVGSLNLTNQDSFIFIDKNNNVGATINKDGIVTSGDVSAGTVSLKSLKTSVDALASTTNTQTKAGLVPAPGASATNKVWKTDGSGNPGWRNDTNTTYTLSGQLSGNTFINTLTPSSGSNTTATVPAMSKATSSAAGKAGLVPAPGAGKQASFLRGDGSWAIPVTISTGDGDGQIKVTPSGGTAYNVDVSGLGTAAYVDTTMFLPATTTYAGSQSIAGPANSTLKLENARTFTIGNTSKDFNGESGVSWSHSEIGYANSSSGLLSASAQTIAGAKTFTSTVTAKTLKISSDTGESHITFSRKGYNYLRAPADGNIALCAADAVAMDSSALVVNNTSVFPGKTNTFSLGTSSYRWKDVYGITGNFNTATITGAILHLQNQNYTKPSDGVVVIPTETKYHWIDFVDSAGTNAANRLGMICQSINSTNGTNRVGMYTYDLTDPTGNTMAYLYTEYDQNGVAKAGSSAPFYGAVWNDYAEFRKYKDNKEIPYGHIVIENGDDSLSLSTARLQKGGNVCSDTFGFAIGETEETKMPIAVAGRALVYTYEDRNSYEPGDAVCTGPNGTISKMTREEIKEYPDCIIGYVSAIPDYEIWGEHNTKVNNRIWIKVK